MVRLLKFLNIIDAQGALSVTNMAVFIALYKLATAPTTNVTEAGTLLVALANYGYKKHLNAKASESEASADDSLTKMINEAKADIEQVKSTTSALALSIGLQK
jgi:hypothetical protein